MSVIKARVCSRCVMDTTDSEIVFDQNGFCNHCNNHFVMAPLKIVPLDRREEALKNKIDEIKAHGKNKKYDCVMGLSGGVDSSYIAYLAHQFGLRVLVVHLDNGWNSEIAVKNIHNIVNKLNFDMVTHVINWEEFRDIQRSFFKANVVDIEMVTDHAISAIVFKLAKKHKVKYILGGSNWATESIMPKTWFHRKSDLPNLLAIHRKWGTVKIKTFPLYSTLRMAADMFLGRVKPTYFLNFMDYNKHEAMEVLKEKLGWRYYGGKHYESVFTRFYQAHILPVKFNIDKRKCHLSSLICSEQIKREDAIVELEKPLYIEKDMKVDYEFVRKKLLFSETEFQEYLRTPGVSHYAYASDESIFRFVSKIRRILGR